jgi:ribonuclease J
MPTSYCGPGTRIIADPHRQKAEADAGRSRLCGSERGKNHKRVGCGFDRNYNLVIEGRPHYSRDKTESDIEHDMADLFSNSDGINLVYTSGQNIDRLVSIYRSCKRTDKIFVVDVYTATVLKTLSEFAALPYPSKNFSDLRVFFPFYLCKRLVNENNEKLMYQFRHYKITKESIAEQLNRIVMLVRPSMKLDLDHIPSNDGGNLIYSLWEGYLQNDSTRRFIQYLEGRGVTLHKIHTSGHADIDTLKDMASAINSKCIVPVHTFRGDDYQKHFTTPVKRLQDGEVVVL